MAKQKMFENFNMKALKEHQQKYADEVKEKYNVDTKEELDKKSEGEWASIMGRSDEIYKTLAANMHKEPADPTVQIAIGAWRQHITDNFYPCTLEIFRGLGDMYVADERFTVNIDTYGEGLAAFMQKAMHIYCDTHSE